MKNTTNKIVFLFQLIFAVIPPPGLLGGWPCFVVSLIMIGLIVIVVGDLAEIFGCLVGLKPEVCRYLTRSVEPSNLFSILLDHSNYVCCSWHLTSGHICQ